MTTSLSPAEEAQLTQTIEMFEVITQSQSQDYQSLEILKEAYSKLGRDKDVVATAKRIAQIYVQMGQLSSAILEYESILQRFPNDEEVKMALVQIESQSSSLHVEASAPVAQASAAGPARTNASLKKRNAAQATGEVDDGRVAMHKIFVHSKHVTAVDFDACWMTPDMMLAPADVVEPFIQLLADKAILPIEKSLRLLVDKSRVGLIPLDRYDLDMELARSFPVDVCRRWCVLPFDRMSKSVLVATANPFNSQAAKELAEATHNRILWYVAPSVEIIKNLRKVFR